MRTQPPRRPSLATRRASRLSLAFLLAAAAPPLPAQQIPAATSIRDDADFDFYDRGPYRPAVPRPDSLLGYAIGDVNTQYAWQERVLLSIADAARDRVVVEPFATTSEGRTMRLYVVSAPENVARLDAIRADLEALADPRGKSRAELDALAARTPAVVMLSFSVHGNESPGFEAAMTVLYQLAASEEPATLDMLRRTVVVINPSSNPDGHERFAVWYNSVNVAAPDPDALEHDEPWSVQGRFNHYRFDMNRDVMASTQREVQGIVGAMLRWKPMVAVDLHGQTEQYFFPPAARPVNEHIGGEQATQWLDAIGRGNAAAFDRYGWLYYVRDVFDLFYPGYWDTWPSLTGATGMTYETDGGGWKGILWRREDGSLLSFRDGIAKHHVASLATIATTAANSTERVRDYMAFRERAVAEGHSGTMKRFVFVPGGDPQRAAELAATLLRAGIEVRRASAPYQAGRAHGFSGGAPTAPAARRFDAGAYVVDLAQPQGKLARAILEPRTDVDTAFARLQTERFARNQQRGPRGVSEGYEFYDVTAWSLPVAFGVEGYWTEDLAAVEGELLSVPRAEPAHGVPMLARDFGAAATPLPVALDGGVVEGANARTAYIFGPERAAAAALAARLMSDGVRVAVATRPIEAGGVQYPRGSYVVRVTRNDSTVHRRVDSLARVYLVPVCGINTAYTTSAQFGVGSEPTVSLEAPRVAMAGGEGVSQTSYGALWWSFERRYGLPFTPLTLDAIAGGALDEYNVLVIPDASPGTLGDRFGKGDALRRWVERGGTLVTMGRASAWAAREDVNLTSARPVAADTTNGDDAGVDSATATPRGRAPTADSLPTIPVHSPGARPDAPASLAGAHFDARLDRTHWLTHGYDDQPTITTLVSGSTFYELARTGTNVAVFPVAGPFHRAGFTWPTTERHLRNTALVIEEPIGDGHVVLFANEPMFRGWWRALDKLVLNGIVLGPGM